MVVKLQELIEAALALPAKGRAALADELMRSLAPKSKAEIEEAWAAEGERRLKAFDAGEMEATPAEEVWRSVRHRKKR